MVSHVVFPYEWVECTSGSDCDHLAHLGLDSDYLNSMPVEWVAAMIGNCELSETHFMWLDENGERHCDDGPARQSEKGFFWFKHGVIHRDGGPAAIRSDGTLEWYQNRMLHREDGPAIVTATGSEGYYLYDESVSKEQVMNH